MANPSLPLPRRATIERVKPSIGAVRLVDLRPAHLERLRDELGARLAPQTVADVPRLVSQAFAKAEAKGLIGRNPAAAALVQRPAGPTRDFPIITPTFGRLILASCEGTDRGTRPRTSRSVCPCGARRHLRWRGMTLTWRPGR